METWKPVVGYEELYEVSSEGQIASLRRLRIMKQTLGKHRYRYVGLSKNGIQKVIDVHVVVAAAFLGPRPEGLVVDHINGNYTDNRAANLQYCTSAINNQKGRLTRLTAEDVRDIRQLHGDGFGTTNLSRKYGVSVNMIGKIVNHKRWRNITATDIGDISY